LISDQGVINWGEELLHLTWRSLSWQALVSRWATIPATAKCIQSW